VLATAFVVSVACGGGSPSATTTPATATTTLSSTRIEWATQVDGKYLGETPMVFRIAPQALSVLLPKGRALAMLGKPASLT
jgi:diacylglycerol kinase family enzyme